MAHKYYLQDILFNNKTKNPTVIMQLTLVITELQVMANGLQTAEVGCVYSHTHTLAIHTLTHVHITDGK